MDVEDAFRKHHEALFRFLVRECGDPHQARDAVQEAFLRLQQKPPRDLAAVRSWLFTTARNVILDERRKAAVRMRLVETSPERLPGPEPAETPEQEMERAQDRRRLRRALDALRPAERTALLMREEGFKHREIAETLGTTTGSVGTLIARALEKLTTALPSGEAIP